MKKRSALKNYEIKYSIDEISKVAKWSWYQIIEIAIINVQPTNQYIYIYIYIKAETSCGRAWGFAMWRILWKELKYFLVTSKIRTKLKIGTFYSFGSMFQGYLLLQFLFNILRLLFISFDSMF